MNEQSGEPDTDAKAPSAAHDSGRIVVGVDGSEASTAALRWAADMAARTGWLLEVVTTWQFPFGFGWDGTAVVAVDWQAETERELASLVGEVFGLERPPGLRTFVLEGEPAHVLIEHARDARMLVVGARGRGGFVGRVLGSVSAKCAPHAHCPVVVVHANDASPSAV